MTILEIKHLTKFYGKNRGTQDVNLEIMQGEIFGFIGPNGAGKSTTIRCIMNLIRGSAGEIVTNGLPVQNSTYRRKESIGYLPSEIHLYEELTVQKMLDYSASFYKKDCRPRMEELVKRLDLDVHKKINALSFGNLKKVGIVLAMMHSPNILIMDEASSGLDPLAQETLYTLLLEEKEKGATVFYSSHILSEIKRICDRVAIIKEGRIIRVTPVEELTESQSVRVTITAPATVDQIRRVLPGDITQVDGDTFKLVYHGDINELLKNLAAFKLQKLLIEELSIEDIFMHYYQ